MGSCIRSKTASAILIGAASAFWTAAAGLAAPTSADFHAVGRASTAASTIASQGNRDAPTLDAIYSAMDRLAQALHGVVVPVASGGLPKLRGYVDADRLANEILGIASTLRDQDAITVAMGTPTQGPDDGRRNVLADLLNHFSEFSSILDRLDQSEHGNDAQSRFTALVSLARLLDVEPKERAEHKFNPATVRGQLGDKKKVREPQLTADQFLATASPTAVTIGAGAAVTAADLGPTDEVQLTPDIESLAHQLGDNAVAIRNWVYNNIDFAPGFGSTQNSQRTLLARRGNAVDTSSLLVALLRAGGIPARYVYGTVDLPADKVINWLGDVPDANSAADLLVKCGIPTIVVTAGGTIKFLRVEHVWVEAYVAFSPSRGARTVPADSWVPMDASFKTYSSVAPLPVLDHVTFDPAAAQNAMLAGSTRGPDWITGIAPSAVQAVDDEIAQQVANYLATQTIADPALIYGKRNIVADDTPLLAGSLPYQVKSAQVYRYDALPSNLQQTIRVALYDSSYALDADSPEFSVSMPLARMGTDAFQVQYVGASASDVSAIQQYAAANSQTLSVGSLTVVPQLRLGTTLLQQGSAVRYGAQQYWKASITDVTGSFSSSTDASVFPAGTAIAFVTDTTGTTPEYATALTAAYGNTANLSTTDALAIGGLQYFLLHDYFDGLVAKANDVAVVRQPTVGTFATALRTSYFFGVPRTSTTVGFVTDVKGLRYATSAPTAEKGIRAMTQVGMLGSLSEGLTWSLLTGRDVGGSLSAATLLLRANEAQIPIYLLNASNLNQDLPGLQLSEDDATDIQNAIASGNDVMVPAREMRIGSWSGVGYFVFDPTTGAGIWRLSGGLNGGIDVGCIEKAISLNVLCKLMFNKLFAQFLAMLSPEALLKKLAEKAVIALVPVVGEIVAVVQLALEIIDITMQVLRWVRGIMNMIDELSQGDLAALGITALNELICSIGSPCFGGGGFFGGSSGGGAGSDGGGGFFGGGLFGDGGMFGGGSPGEPVSGNPISVGNGIKWQWERDYDGEGAYPLQFVRTYNSSLTNGSLMGNKWSHSYQSSIHVAPAPLGGDTTPATAVEAVLVQHGDGTYAQYVRRGSSYAYESNLPEPLVRLTDGAGGTAGWEVTRLSDEVEHYDSDGRLQWVRNRAGLRHTLLYNGQNQLVSVSDDFGRSLRFSYDATTGLLASMTDPDDRVTSYSYAPNGNATGVTYPDTKSRGYLYEDPMLASYLTGIVDERAVRYATFAYDYRGRAVLSTHSGDAGKISLAYGDNTTTVTDALGTTRTYRYTLFNQRQYLVQVDQPCSAGCAAGGVSKQSFDGNGFVATRSDFNNNITAFVHNARGLVTSRTDASGSAQARTVTTQWHATYHLPTQVVEPLPNGASRTDTMAYDSQGNLQSATALAGSDSRQWTYTYNAHGQVLTAKSPRTDLSSIVAYRYDDSTGNRIQMTDAVGHATQYTDYDAHGRLKQKIDANGLITKYDYDLRGRLTSVTEQTSASDPGEATGFDYDGAGELTKLTLPDGSYLSYTYDDAQRLTDIADSLGNSVHYTLDGLGNRTREDTNDAGHVLAQTLSRVIDALGRVQEFHGAQPDEVTRYAYEPNGNEHSVTDPLSHSTSSTYDALNRLQQTSVLDASDPAHAVIGYGYDIRDNLTSVVDPRQLQTSYAYSGFDELLTLTSPDTGVTQYQYDPTGNLTIQTDARSKRAIYSYDSADRLLQVQYGQAGTGTTLSSTEEVISFGYDEPAGGAGALGRLTHADVTGTPLGLSHLAYQYDTHGRVTQKIQQLGSGPALTTQTHYNDRGQRDEVTLPSGAVISYAYGADGRVTTIAVNGIVIVRDVAYFPFGDPEGWTEATTSGTPYTRQYDTDGRVTSHREGSVNRLLAYDPASRITSIVDSGVGGTANWTYGYDDQDRLTSASNSSASGTTSGVNQGFAYDATGNRTSAANNGTTTVYTTDALSNRLTQVGSSARNYDAAGNTTDWVGPTGAIHAVYSARNRLIQTQIGAPLASYAYDAWGERVGKQGANYTQFVYDEDGHLIGEYDQGGRLVEETLWLDDTPIAVLKLKTGAGNGSAIGGGSATPWQGLSAGGVEAFFVESDQLDSPRAIVNQSHQLVWQWDSDPFGITQSNEAPGTAIDITTNFSYNLRFPGQYFDAETRTHYNYFRDYEPAAGGYVESDPSGLGDGPNTYAYVHGKPLYALDFEGLGFIIKKPYKRPPNSTTPEQRKRVQGRPCHECGTITNKQRADHPIPLVQEYWETGTIDLTRMRDVKTVRPHCPICSNRQGGFMSAYSKRMRKLYCGG